MNLNRRLKTLKNSFFNSNNQSIRDYRSNQPQTVDFQEYLRTEHNDSSQSCFSSCDYLQEQDMHSSHQQNSSSNDDHNNNLIEICENYTFAEDLPSQRKQNMKYLNFNEINPIIRRRKHFSQFQERQLQNPPQLNLDSSDFTEKEEIASSQISSSEEKQKQISLSDNEEDKDVTIYNSKTIQEEMFLKISEQTKQILLLQEKVYYFEDFCKRLLKSHEEEKQKYQKIADQLTNVNRKSKEKSQKIKQLEKKLIQNQKQIQNLASEQKKSKKFQQSSLKKQTQKRILSQKQNLQEISLLESEKKAINEKYQLCLTQNEKLQSKFIFYQQELLKYQKENESLRKSNKNIQNVNKILQKQISELNIKIFQFERQMEELTCQKYFSNLTRIKCMTQTSPAELFYNKPSILRKLDSFDIESFKKLRR